LAPHAPLLLDSAPADWAAAYQEVLHTPATTDPGRWGDD
jgi:hypothetical protein